MNLFEIQFELARLPYQHPQADTNVQRIENVGTDICFATDASEFEEQIKELTEERDDAHKEIKKLSGEVEQLEARLDKLNATFDELRDPNSGLTVRRCVSRMENAEKEAKAWAKYCRDARYAQEAAERETKALRKKKGIECGVVRHAHEVVTLLHYISNTKIERLPDYQNDCRKMIEKLHTS